MRAWQRTRAVALALALLFVPACGGGDDNPGPQVIDMGTLAVGGGPVSATVSGDDVHIFTFASAGAAQHRVIVTPTNGSQDPDVGVFSPGGSLVGSSIACEGVTDTVTFAAAASTTYTVQVVNGGGCGGGLTSAAYTVQVLSP